MNHIDKYHSEYNSAVRYRITNLANSIQLVVISNDLDI